jgi:hypothetical protein
MEKKDYVIIILLILIVYFMLEALGIVDFLPPYFDWGYP